MTAKNTGSKGPISVSEPAIIVIDHDDHRARTKDGIAQARAAGVSWGPHGKVLADRNRAAAAAFAETLRPLFVELGIENHRGPTAIAQELNRRRVPGLRRGRWHPTPVKRLRDRLGPTLGEEIRKRQVLNAPEWMAKLLPPDHPILLRAIARRDALAKEMAK